MSLSPRYLNEDFAVSPQVTETDIGDAARAGFKTILCARPDREQAGQPEASSIEAAAKAAGLEFVHIAIPAGTVPTPDQIEAMSTSLATLPRPMLGYCRSGMRAGQLWALAQSHILPREQIISDGDKAGLNFSSFLPPETTSVTSRTHKDTENQVKHSAHYNVIIVGGGAGGISVAASLLKRQKSLSIAIIEPSEQHYYQPGWTLVGGGVFNQSQTRRREADLIPRGIKWIKASASRFNETANTVDISDGSTLHYDSLVIACGISLNWGAIDGLTDTLGKNGVTSNYRFDLAPYTWQLVQSLKRGRALFTQPPMPIKCAGAPQKAMYLSCDYWRKHNVLRDIDVSFDTATPSLFGVAAYVPALQRYIEHYGITTRFTSRLISVDGSSRIATFERNTSDGPVRAEQEFDMLHVVPPQVAPEFIRSSPFSGPDGFVAVDPATLRHVSFENVFALGDVAGTTNAKTAAAVRKQAPVVAENVVAYLSGRTAVAQYNGYGACPLTVERGKIVLAEFAYGGTLDPSMPKWLLDGTNPTRLAWFLKETVMPALYWHGMLKGHEILVKPKRMQKH